MKMHPIIPGAMIDGDWFQMKLPTNIEVGQDCQIDSSHVFKNYHSQKDVGLSLGNHVKIMEASLAVEEDGYLKIGDNCVIGSAAIVVSNYVEIGNNVFVAGGVTIVDSNFHPIEPEARKRDILALSPGGDRSNRPIIKPRPVRIGDFVWVGYNATIMSGVSVGSESIIEPGAVVIKDVPPRSRVAGNPAQLV